KVRYRYQDGIYPVTITEEGNTGGDYLFSHLELDDDYLKLDSVGYPEFPYKQLELLMPPCSDEKIYANLTDFILSAIPIFYVIRC
ncbi:MAG: hypothetical protein ACFNLO_04960, partial [Selenomonas massiliensis]